MQKHRKVNVVSYSGFIKFMGTSHNPVSALQAYNTIQDESTRNNSSICNSVLGCLVRNGKFDASMKLFDQMKSGGLMPNAVTYSTVCHCNFLLCFIIIIMSALFYQFRVG